MGWWDVEGMQNTGHRAQQCSNAVHRNTEAFVEHFQDAVTDKGLDLMTFIHKRELWGKWGIKCGCISQVAHYHR